jgi:hypothetical protein
MEGLQVTYNVQELQIMGQIEDVVDNGVLEFLAAAPPEVRPSYHGTGLPWSSRSQAMDNTPNIGKLQVTSNKEFSFKVVQPNAYYDDGKLVTPCVELYYQTNGVLQTKILALDDIHVSDRSLRYSSHRTSPEFYQQPTSGARTQAEIFASKAVSECPSFLTPYRIVV